MTILNIRDLCDTLTHTHFIYIGLMNRVFTNGPGDRDSILGRVIQETQKSGT